MTERTEQIVTWRPLTLDDVTRISDWFWDFADAALFDRSLPVPVSADTLRSIWRCSLEQTSAPDAFWFIAQAADGTPLGIAGLDKVNYIQGDAVLPFFVAPEFRKRGLASIMSVSLLDLAFNRLRLHRVTTYYRADNTASEKVFGRLGFTIEGRMREGWFSNGKRNDVVVTGILSSEWAAQRESIEAELEKKCDLRFEPTCWMANHG